MTTAEVSFKKLFRAAISDNEDAPTSTARKFNAMMSDETYSECCSKHRHQVQCFVDQLI